MIFSILNSKFTLLDKKQDRYLLIVIVFVFSIFFLNVFQPFNISRWFSDSAVIQFLRLSSYGAVVAVVFLFTQFPLRHWLKKQTFEVKHYIAWICLEIILISLVYIFLYGNPVGNFMNDLVFSVKYTLLGICLPYSFAVLIIYYKNQKAEIENFRKTINQPASQKLIGFKDEYGKPKFSVHSFDILFIESTDNYVSVHFLQNNKPRRELLRNSLKKMEELLHDSSVIRCHRSFMINTQHIDFLQNQGKKQFARIRNFDQSIPVSEKYATLFSQHFK